MIKKIIEFSLHNKLIVFIGVIGLFAIGVYQFTLLPIDAVPDITNNQVQIITNAPALSAADIERQITRPLEQSIANIPGTIELRSFSRFGLSLITIVFDEKTDVYWARQQVSEKINDIKNTLPPEMGSPYLGPVTTGLGEIFQYSIYPKKGFENKYSNIELRTIQDWVIRKHLLEVPGVADVSSFGGKLKQYHIVVDPNKLIANNLSIEDISNAVQKNNSNAGGGYKETNEIVTYIHSDGLIKNQTDIENILINNATGNTFKLRDVAEIKIGNATRYGALSKDGKGDVAGAVVMMRKGANSNIVIEKVKQKVEEIKKLLPEGIELNPFLDRTKMVNNAIGTVRNNLLEGAIIVVIILILFLGNYRAAFIVASIIPLAMLFAVCLMNLFGVSGNLMSLGALDFGLIVDGAVIIVESILHKFITQSINNNINAEETILNQTSKMMKSAIFGQCIILIVYLPIFTLSGIESKMFIPMAQTIIFALIGAFILSITYIPAVCALLLKKHQEINISKKIIQKINNIYQVLLFKSLRKLKLIISLVIVIFIGSIILLINLGAEFIPTLEEGDFAVEFRLIPGTNIKTTLQYAQQASELIKNKFPEVQQVVAKIGSGEIPTDPMPMEAADLMIILKPKSEWKSANSFKELAEKMSEQLANIPGIAYSFQYPVQMRFNELMTGAKQDVVCKIYGENLDTLATLAKQFSSKIGNIKGIDNLYTEEIIGSPQLIIEFDRNKLLQYNINIDNANNLVHSYLAGKQCGSVFEDEKKFDIIVKLNMENYNIEQLKELPINSEQGPIPISQIANVYLKENPVQIQRENGRRRAIVAFNVLNRDVQSVVNDVQKSVSKFRFPSGYFVQYGGAFENLQKASKRLAIAVPIALLLIFVILFFSFHSIKNTLIIYSAIPLSIIGGVLFLAFRGMPFSISAGIGFVALFGVCVLNGIVLISEFTYIKSLNDFTLIRVVKIGAANRLRPILMTALVASLGFLPMALSTGSGAEVQKPLATVVIGGLLISTLLTLFVLPMLYLLFYTIKFNKKTVLFVPLIAIFFIGNGQKISLDSAMNLAVKNNKMIQGNKQNVEAYKVLKNSWNGLTATEINQDFGQINTYLPDYRFSFAQSFPLPKTINSQKMLNTANFDYYTNQLQQTEIQIKKQLFYWYVNSVACQEMLHFLLNYDTVLKRALFVAELKSNLGESGKLEKINLQQKYSLFETEKTITMNNKKIAELYLGFLINVNNPIVKNDTLPINWETELQLDTQLYQLKNSQLQLEKKLLESKLAVEKSQLLPNFTLTYANTSFNGTDPRGKINYVNNRFHAMSVGLQLPIFTTMQYKKIRALNYQLQAQNNFVNYSATKINIEKLQRIEKMYMLKNNVLVYLHSLIPNAHRAIEIGLRQYESGEINYLEWQLIQENQKQIFTQYIQLKMDLALSFMEYQYGGNE